MPDGLSQMLDHPQRRVREFFPSYVMAVHFPSKSDHFLQINKLMSYRSMKSWPPTMPCPQSDSALLLGIQLSRTTGYISSTNCPFRWASPTTLAGRPNTFKVVRSGKLQSPSFLGRDLVDSVNDRQPVGDNPALPAIPTSLTGPWTRSLEFRVSAAFRAV